MKLLNPFIPLYQLIHSLSSSFLISSLYLLFLSSVSYLSFLHSLVPLYFLLVHFIVFPYIISCFLLYFPCLSFLHSLIPLFCLVHSSTSSLYLFLISSLILSPFYPLTALHHSLPLLFATASRCFPFSSVHICFLPSSNLVLPFSLPPFPPLPPTPPKS